jgi:ribonucleoside-diphosphate reductase beta chain
MTDLFFGPTPEIARFDKIEYPWISKLTKKQRGFFWQPEEIDLAKDPKQFKALDEHKQHIFTSNLQRQILLDTKQGRDPAIAFLPIASVPELEQFIITWTFFETIHSESYTHIIQNIYPDPSVVLDKVLDIPEIVACKDDISRWYDDLIENPSPETLLGAMLAVNALEGIRFYVSFACSWAFAEQKQMEGNAKIIKLIARDENLHLAFTQQAIKVLAMYAPNHGFYPKEYIKTVGPQIFEDVINQEVAWAEYLFKDGGMLGLNADILKEYVYYIGWKRATAIGITLPNIPKVRENPLPWTQRWIGGVEVQNAPQEVENTMYVVGGIEQDVTSDFLSKLKI